MVVPEFPREAKREKRSGTVVVEGVIETLHGALKDWKLHPEREADSIFVPAVEAVIADWRFRRGTKGCLPVDTPIATRIFFEWDGDQPKVSTLRPVVDRTFTPAASFVPLTRVNPRFPAYALRRGVMATVYARMRVETDGQPSSVEVAVYPPEYPDLRKPFGESVQAALSQWRYPERAEGPWFNCVQVDFVIKD